jgi:glycosyltransferase involved in cell wall biosynthesis
MNQDETRAMLGLPRDKKLILMITMNSFSDPRKGFGLLLKACDELANNGLKDEAEVILLGTECAPLQAESLPLPLRCMGVHYDDVTVAAVCSAVDVCVVPSIQDNLPNTLMEALACGTPCVGFRVGGIPDLIEHQKTGYLATAFDTADLARGIHWILEDEERRKHIGREARKKIVENFSSSTVARRYVDLYQDVLDSQKPSAPH